jgi:hypothetical protein
MRLYYKDQFVNVKKIPTGSDLLISLDFTALSQKLLSPWSLYLVYIISETSVFTFKKNH